MASNQSSDTWKIENLNAKDWYSNKLSASISKSSVHRNTIYLQNFLNLIKSNDQGYLAGQQSSYVTGQAGEEQLVANQSGLKVGLKHPYGEVRAGGLI